MIKKTTRTEVVNDIETPRADNPPEGLRLIPSWTRPTTRTYQYDAPDGAVCEFLIRNDGRVEISTGDAPAIPVEVLKFIAAKSDELRRV